MPASTLDFGAKPKPRNGLDSVSHGSEAIGCLLCLLLKTNRLHEAALHRSGRDKAVCPVLPQSRTGLPRACAEPPLPLHQGLGRSPPNTQELGLDEIQRVSTLGSPGESMESC